MSNNDKAEELKALIEKLEFGCPFVPGTVGVKDAVRAERIMQKAAETLRSLNEELTTLRDVVEKVREHATKETSGHKPVSGYLEGRYDYANRVLSFLKEMK